MSRTYKDRPRKLTDYYWQQDAVSGINEEGRYFTIYSKTTKTKKKKSVDTEWHWYRQTPSWWTHEFMIVPMRAAGKRWDSIVAKTAIEDLDTLNLPNVSNKPHVYYW